MKNKIGFCLMTFKGYYVLQQVLKRLEADIIEHVIIGKDADILNDYSKEMEMLCQQHSIDYSFREAKYIFISDYVFAVSWRWLIESEKKLIVLHDSILPTYRGFAPLVNSLTNGEEKIGVTALFASSEYDKGDIITQKYIRINYPIKIIDVMEQISVLYADLVVDIVINIIDGEGVQGVSQDETKASYSLWLDEDDYRINWNVDAARIKRMVDATGYPYKGASALLDGRLIRVIEADEQMDVVIVNRTPGKIIFMETGLPVVVCGSGLLKITKAIYDDTGQSIFPLKRFRTKFK